MTASHIKDDRWRANTFAHEHRSTAMDDKAERYPAEELDRYNDDNGTMPDNVETLAAAVVGHRIVKSEMRDNTGHYGCNLKVFVITLDNGTEVQLDNTDDCCAYTELQEFLLHPEMVDHVIMGVGTTESYNTWHIYADLGDVLELTVGWSCGNPFHYGYGFSINVVECPSN